LHRLRPRLFARAIQTARRRSSCDGPPELGDVVSLGRGAPQEYAGRRAVVTRVSVTHCTVVALDNDRRRGIGECWPSFGDVTIESTAWRLGNRVVIHGLQSARTKRFNGLTGTISAHPREGHPTFVRKPAAPDQPLFTLCIRLDDPRAAGQTTVLLEPRFLAPYGDVVVRLSDDLKDVAASLSSSMGV